MPHTPLCVSHLVSPHVAFLLQGFGSDAGISNDGSVIVIGAMGPSGAAGSVYVYTMASGSYGAGVALTPTGTAPLPAADSQFGSSVTISTDGTQIVACAQMLTVSSTAGAGKCWLWQMSSGTWTQRAGFTAPAQNANMLFGGNDGSIAVSNPLSDSSVRVLVGAPGSTVAGVAGGQAWVFSISSTFVVTQVELLPVSTANAGGQFGTMVALSDSGTTAIVAGMTNDAMGHAGAGTVAVYDYASSAWSTGAEVTAPDLGDTWGFGSGLSISQDAKTLAVGAYTADVTGSNAGAGSAYIFKRSATSSTRWAMVQQVLPAAAETNQNFGYNVALSGDAAYLLASAPYADAGSVTDAGANFGFVMATGSSSGDDDGLSVTNKAIIGGVIGGVGGAILGAVLISMCTRGGLVGRTAPKDVHASPV